MTVNLLNKGSPCLNIDIYIAVCLQQTLYRDIVAILHTYTASTSHYMYIWQTSIQTYFRMKKLSFLFLLLPHLCFAQQKPPINGAKTIILYDVTFQDALNMVREKDLKIDGMDSVEGVIRLSFIKEDGYLYRLRLVDRENRLRITGEFLRDKPSSYNNGEPRPDQIDEIQNKYISNRYMRDAFDKMTAFAKYFDRKIIYY